MKTTGSDQCTIPGTPRATKFSLAANYDPELVPRLAGYILFKIPAITQSLFSGHTSGGGSGLGVAMMAIRALA
jgi:hypothetical protein